MIRKNKFLSSILVIASGTALAQIINLLFTPIVTRIYTPEEFGVVALFTVFISILGISTLMFEVAIPVSDTDKHATNLFFGSIVISFLINLSLFLIIIVFKDPINILFGFNDYSSIIYLIPLGALLVSLFKVSREWTIRKSNYKSISQAAVVQSLSGNVSKVVFGLLGFSAFGLAISRIITGSFGVTTLIRPYSKEIIKSIKLQTSMDLLKTLGRYKDFAFYMTPNNLITILIVQFPIIVIGILYDPEIVGFYSLAHTMIMLPIAVLGDSISDVFYSESAKMIKTSPVEVLELSKNLLVKLFLISLIPALILFIFGPQLFEFIFGEEWYHAGVFSQILCLVLISKMTFHPMNKIFELIEKQKYKFILNIFQLMLLVLLFIFSSMSEINSLNFIILYSVIIFLMNLIMFMLSYILLKIYIYSK